MLERLRAELRSTIPNRDSIAGWADLEKLPYLVLPLPWIVSLLVIALTFIPQRAVIKESLRLSYGVPGRMPRVVPNGGAVLCGQNIPAGVRTPPLVGQLRS